VAKRRPEPRWLNRVVVDAIHNDQLREHGGLPGIRDENVLESAIARPQQKWHYYAEQPDVAVLAAAYAFGLVKNHPFVDGNKRIAFATAVVFLELNGYRFEAGEADAVVRTLALAAGELKQLEYAQWLKAQSKRA
jgi:death-on-curing protein